MGWWQQHFFHRVWGKIKWKTREALKKRCASAAAKSLQSCPTLCDPIDSSPPGSPIPGILQARTPEWVAISLSNAWKWKVEVKSLSRIRLLATPWTAAYQAPLSMGFYRQEYWSGLTFPPPGHLLDPGIETMSPAFQADSLLPSPWGTPSLTVHAKFTLC